MATPPSESQAHLGTAAVADPDVMDIQCLLNDLNLDGLIAGLDTDRTPAAGMTPPLARMAVERRGSKRVTASELGREVRLTIPGASQTTLVNISQTGALVETTRRLCPGKTTDVFVRFDGERRPLRVTIMRSTLHSLIPVPIYRTALHFDRILPLTV